MRLNFSHFVLGVLVVLAIAGGVALTVWPSASDSPIQVVELIPTATAAPASTPIPSNTQVGVYLSGAVMNPGVYLVNGGSRLVNVLLLAGGATTEADLTSVNLAVVVNDEDHWHIPKRGEAPPAANGLAASTQHGKQTAEAHVDGKIDLNAADVDLLKALPGIGDVRAQAIVSHREANGDFESVDGLLDVDGIGSGILENIRDLVTVQ